MADSEQVVAAAGGGRRGGYVAAYAAAAAEAGAEQRRVGADGESSWAAGARWSALLSNSARSLGTSGARAALLAARPLVPVQDLSRAASGALTGGGPGGLDRALAHNRKKLVAPAAFASWGHTREAAARWGAMFTRQLGPAQMAAAVAGAEVVRQASKDLQQASKDVQQASKDVLQAVGGASGAGGVGAFRRYGLGLVAWQVERSPTYSEKLAALAGQWGASRQGTFAASYRTLLDAWGTIASWACALGRWARSAIVAALSARDAAVHGRHTEVEAFMEHWLQVRPTPVHLEAVVAALLEDDWIPEDTVDDDLVLHQLRRSARRQIRNFRLLGETQLRGYPVAMLDRPLPRPAHDGTALTLADALIDPATRDGIQVDPLDDGATFADRRLIALKAMLRPAELEVALAWRESDVTTWREAAARAGRPELAETVRRKCRRISAELERRGVASTTAGRRTT